VGVIDGLFDGAALPGQTGFSRSPELASAADPTFVMSSSTSVVATAADAQALAAPFASSIFTPCFARYQTALASAAVPGATAQVEQVGLTAPAGVEPFGYLTTFTLPNQGTEVVGEAFLIGGRVETLLTPSTTGAPIPSTDFVPAFNAIAGRIATTLK
jgi:hypothetical protein